MSIEQIIARQEEIIEKGVTKFSHYMDWFDEFQKQGHYRMDDNDIREILSSSIKEILEGIKQIEAGKNIEEEFYTKSPVPTKEELRKENMKKVYSEDGMKMTDWLVSDDTGASSISILIHMSGSKSMKKNSPPSDKWDRGRCIRLLKLFPEWIERLDEMKIYKGWSEQIELIKKEL